MLEVRDVTFKNGVFVADQVKVACALFDLPGYGGKGEALNPRAGAQTPTFFLDAAPRWALQEVKKRAEYMRADNPDGNDEEAFI